MQLDFGRPLTPPAVKGVHHGLTTKAELEPTTEGVHHGLLTELEPEPTDPLGCRWRAPLSWAYNPSVTLTLYRDQLDAQTPDQVIVD